MELLDIMLLVGIVGFALVGFRLGFVHALGSLLGLVIGTYLAFRYYSVGAAWIMGFTGWEGNVMRVVVFVIAFILINRLVGWLFWFLERFINILLHLPFLRTFNRIGGFVLGAFEGALTLGLIVYFIERFPLSDAIMQAVAESDMAAFVSNVAHILVPLLPEAFTVLKSTVDYAEGVIL